MKLRKTKSSAMRLIGQRHGWPSRPSSRSLKQNEEFTRSSRMRPRGHECLTCMAVLITEEIDLCVCCHVSCAERSCGDRGERRTRRDGPVTLRRVQVRRHELLLLRGRGGALWPGYIAQSASTATKLLPLRGRGGARWARVPCAMRRYGRRSHCSHLRDRLVTSSASLIAAGGIWPSRPSRTRRSQVHKEACDHDCFARMIVQEKDEAVTRRSELR
jgi:hypothetical protein